MYTFSWTPYPADETIHKAEKIVELANGEKQIINLLDDGHNGYYKNYRYHPITLGFIVKSNNKLSDDISYGSIKPQTVITDPVDYTVKHKAEIKDYSVYLNDRLIASAPGKKSKAQKEKFCKAVIWALMNDPISLQDKLAEISLPEKPVFPAGYIPYLRLSITEEVCTA